MSDDFDAFVGELRPFMDGAFPSWVCGATRAGAQPVSRPLTPSIFETLAIRLFNLQFVENAPYRAWCESMGRTPGQVSEVPEIPAVPAAAFKELEFSCLPPAERSVVFHSSGTSEQRPSRHFHNERSLELYEASLKPWFARHLLDDTPAEDLCFVSLTPRAADAPRSSLAHMLETVRREFCPRDFHFAGKVDRGEWRLDFAPLISTLERAMATRRPILLAGTAFNFVHLIDALLAAGRSLELPPGSRVMETGGYKGRSRELAKSELHELMGRSLGIQPDRIVCEYGMSELSSQAYDHCIRAPASGEPRQFRFPPWCRALVVSPETGRVVEQGETGVLRLVDLANVWSAMALQTEDLAVRRGDGFELLGRARRAEARGCSLLAA